MNPEIPAQSQDLAHFRLMEKIGEGGMGVVHKAWDTRLERVVALKVISRELLRHDQSRTRLLREARIASSLNHPNIATIYGLEEADGKDIIVMEYVQGPTLRTRLGGGPIEVRDVLDLAVAVADALGEAHAQNVVHRDIKPENIILTPRGHPKIMDFGLAKLLRTDATTHDGTTGVGRATTRITSEGAALGTVAYMSPEQATGKEVDVRTDVFSFGVVLYEMLTHAAAFSGDSDVDILYEILHREPRPISELNPDVPSDLQDIVSRCTAKDRAARYPSATKIREDLKRALISLDVQRAHTLHTLFSISREMTSILSLEPLLERTAALVKSLIAYDMLGIFRADMKNGRLYWLGGSGYDPKRTKEREYRADEGICGRAIRSREVVRVGDVSKDADYYPPNGQQFASNLVVPLIHGDKVIGVLNMESRRPNFFTKEHVTIMVTLAGPIAVAMENARLFEKQKDHARALEMLHDIGREVASILDLDLLLERVGELTRRMIDHELFTVFLLDEDGEFTWRAAQGYDPGFIREKNFRLGEGVISRAAKLREALIVNDTSADPDYIHPRSADGRPMRSELAVPLVAQDKVLGVLTLESVEPEHFLPEHSRIMTVLASQVAVAIGNAEVYREVQDRVRDRQAEAERIRKRFESYVTPHIAEELFRDPKAKALAGERRPVSVLVADIRGFTPLAETLPSEVVVEFLQGFFSVMTHVVFKYEGTVDKFLGDALMAFYGAPVAHDPRYGPSDSQRAVFASLDMREAFLRLRDKWWERHSECGSLELCVGISTGVCLLGNMGSDKRVEYTAVGSVVNQAFRLCREAGNGEIRIGEQTHADVHDDVRVEPAADQATVAEGQKAHVVVGLKYLS